MCVCEFKFSFIQHRLKFNHKIVLVAFDCIILTRFCLISRINEERFRYWREFLVPSVTFINVPPLFFSLLSFPLLSPCTFFPPFSNTTILISYRDSIERKLPCNWFTAPFPSAFKLISARKNNAILLMLRQLGPQSFC